MRELGRRSGELQRPLVGFRLPAYLGTTNATGYHLHFVSDDETVGGHVLELESGALDVEIAVLDELFVSVPLGK